MKTLTTLLLALLLTSGSIQATGFAGGSGAKDDPFQVATPHHLNEVRNHTDKYFLQIADINLNIVPYNMGNYWIPIGGNRSNNNTQNNFRGHYDGNGYSISNLTIVQPGSLNVGLFGHIGSSDEKSVSLKKIKLHNVVVIGGQATGALVGRVTGNQNTRIENCSVESGYVSGDGETGGLIGSNNSYMVTSVASEGFRPVVYKCFSDVSVLLRSEYSTGKKYFGGLVGSNEKGMISHSYSLGEVIANHNMVSYVGGLTGSIELRGVVINSYSASTVIADSTSKKGGLTGGLGIGRNKGIIYNSYWNKDVNDPNLNSDGAIGLTNLQMQNQENFKGWDFNSMWTTKANLNNGFPVLSTVGYLKNEKIWTGSVSDDWNYSGNWSPEGVPSSQERVVIDGEAIRQPVVSGHIQLNEIKIHDNATLTLKHQESAIIITGSLLGSIETTGTAKINGLGYVVLAGNSLQSIPALSFENLVVDNPNNVQLAGSVWVNGLLKMSKGLLDLRGFEINLGENAELQEVDNDNISSRVYGSSGVIRTQRYLNNPEGPIAGLGIEITSDQNLGLTTIERGHSPLNEGDESKSILRWFNIEPAYNHNLNATLVFHYFISELNVYGENDNFSLFRRKHGDTEWVWIPSELNPYKQMLTAHGVDEFSTWTAGSTDKPLPIVLFSWDAKAHDNIVELTWITAAEINNDYFTIERSNNGIDFQIIGTIEGKGTTSQISKYSMLDYEPISGIAYYRLKQTDFNGDFEYSRTVSVNTVTKLADNFRVFPNPNNGQFNILSDGENAILYHIYDMQGRLVANAQTEPGQISRVSLPSLKQGIYNIVFYTDEVFSQKIQIN